MGSTLLTIPPLALEFTGSATPAAYGVRNGHRMVKFKDAGNTEAFYSNFMPEGYVGSGLSVTISWMAEDATTGDVDWDVSFERLAAGGQDLDSDNFNAPKTALSSTTAAAAGQLIYTTIQFSAAEAANLQPNEKFRIRVRRLGDNVSDNMVNDAQVTDVSINQVAFSGTLTVEEQDGNPSVTGVRKIKVANATLTDEGGDTVSLASGGGGGGFFGNGSGTDSAVGAGSVTPPLAPGNVSLASGEESIAGVVSTKSHSFAWGRRAFARGAESQAFGDNVGYNDYDLLTVQVEGPDQSFIAGKDIRACSWMSGLFLQGLNIKMSNDLYGAGGLFALYDDHSSFAQGKNIVLEHNQQYYTAGDYYGASGAAFVWGDDNSILSANMDIYGRAGQIAICMGINNTLNGVGGAVFGTDNITEFDSGNTPFLFGDGNILPAGSDLGGWFFLQDTTAITRLGRLWFLWGQQHSAEGVFSTFRDVFLGGEFHHVITISNEKICFIWGRSGTNGHQAGNDNLFAWSAGVGVEALQKGNCQWSFILDFETTGNATQSTISNLNTDFRRGYLLVIEVTAYDSVNNNQIAVFRKDDIAVYRSAHTGAPVLVPVGPVTIPRVQDSGGNAATWLVDLAVNGTIGVIVRVTGSATETVRWTSRISYLQTGWDAA